MILGRNFLAWGSPVLLIMATLSSSACSRRDYTQPDAGNGGTPGNDDGEGGGGTTSSNTGPSIVSVSPEDGETGVAADAVIVITFSEAMDKAATQAAYGSTNDAIKASEVTFAWNSGGTELTVTPNAPLPYKLVTDPSAAPDEFGFSIGTAAKSKDGDELGEAFSATFRTLKRVTQTIQQSMDPEAEDAPESGAISYGEDSTNYAIEATKVVVGCGGGTGLAMYRGFWAYDLSGVPENITLESAHLDLLLVSDNAFTLNDNWTKLASLRIAPVSYAPPLLASANYYDVPISGGLVVEQTDFDCSTTSCTGPVDETAAIQAAVADRIASENRAQFGTKATTATTDLNCDASGARLHLSGPLVLEYTVE
ncbi:MAG TPA: Ig-like domain-containing protein [Polyangiaceae bacterium]|nr:Ig-like domain-containing protein [Polyangiaceae bacterium]